jgi:quercetin dioxygenase-like cupin family protein
MPAMDETVIEIGALRIRYLIDGVVSGAASGMFELTVPPGARVPPPHSHSGNEEIIYCLEGVLRCLVGGDARDLKPGEKSFTPRGEVHAFSNPFDQTARALVVITPDIGAQYFKDVAEVATAPGGPDPAKMAAVMGRYGLKLAGAK